MNVYLQRKPNEQNWERLVSEALEVAAVPGAVLQNTVRPPLPQIETFPPRFGYLDYTDRQLGIRDVLGSGRLYGDNRDAVSGGPGGYQAASRNVQGLPW